MASVWWTTLTGGVLEMVRLRKPDVEKPASERRPCACGLPRVCACVLCVHVFMCVLDAYSRRV